MLQHSQRIVLSLLDHLVVLIKVQRLHPAAGRHALLHGFVRLDNNILVFLVLLVLILLVTTLHSHIHLGLPLLLAVGGVAVGDPIIERNAVLRRHRQASSASPCGARSSPTAAATRAATTRAKPAICAGVSGPLLLLYFHKGH